jgi:regulator of RNase E activity RraA
VSVSGVVVRPGDVIVGDQDGVRCHTRTLARTQGTHTHTHTRKQVHAHACVFEFLDHKARTHVP